MPDSIVYMQAHCHSRYSINRLSGEGVFHRVVWPVERQIMKALMRSPKQLCEIRAKSGVQFVAVTDHNAIPKISGSALIPGEEWGQTKGHANFINVEKQIDPECGYFRNHQPDDPKDFIGAATEARSQGAFISINHPFKRDAWLWGDESYGFADAIEVWNGKWNDENFRALQLWQALLLKGKKLLCMAGNDFHVNHLSDLGSQVLAFKDVFDRDSIIENLRKGNYSVARDTESPVVFLDSELNYKIENHFKNMELRIISENSSFVRMNAEREGPAKLENAKKFIRLELWDEAGPLSFTNPVFLNP
jgi:predicted metal-dependent phosphoesterase TrpH